MSKVFYLKITHPLIPSQEGKWVVPSLVQGCVGIYPYTLLNIV